MLDGTPVLDIKPYLSNVPEAPLAAISFQVTVFWRSAY
jgi:tRNA (Thr-GGU) A37 N-methylase